MQDLYRLRRKVQSLTKGRLIMNITVEGTPNPNALKFSVEKKLVATGSAHFKKGDDTNKAPLATELFIGLIHNTRIR